MESHWVGISSARFVVLCHTCKYCFELAGPKTSHPGAYLLHQLTEPVMAPVRRMLPNLGGLDFSPILVFIIINMVDMLVIQNLASSFGMPRGLVLGL